ncbi:MAG: GNAT family N-acetyltransferase [Thermoplasmata archaeon]|nr:GNAT family N-acetyltransferase [Thermoplasmata archaeon]
MAPPPAAPVPARLIDLPPSERERAVPILVDSFVGIYRWHAKRTLREVTSVRGAEIEGELVAVAMLERLVPEVGYVYYLAVASAHRRTGLGGLLLDDALDRFRRDGATIVYAAVPSDNTASLRLFQSRGLRVIERKELGYREGGLGAWGLRSRMRLVYGEVLLGRRLAGEDTVAAGPPTRGQVGSDDGPGAVSRDPTGPPTEPRRRGLT